MIIYIIIFVYTNNLRLYNIYNRRMEIYHLTNRNHLSVWIDLDLSNFSFGSIFFFFIHSKHSEECIGFIFNCELFFLSVTIFPPVMLLRFKNYKSVFISI